MAQSWSEDPGNGTGLKTRHYVEHGMPSAHIPVRPVHFRR
jgi:hypothetical protein